MPSLCEYYDLYAFDSALFCCSLCSTYKSMLQLAAEFLRFFEYKSRVSALCLDCYISLDISGQRPWEQPEIFANSSNTFKSSKPVFFSMKTRHILGNYFLDKGWTVLRPKTKKIRNICLLLTLSGFIWEIDKPLTLSLAADFITTCTKMEIFVTFICKKMQKDINMLLKNQTSYRCDFLMFLQCLEILQCWRFWPFVSGGGEVAESSEGVEKRAWQFCEFSFYNNED